MVGTMQTAWYLVKLGVSLLGGALFARLVGRQRFKKSATVVGDGVLYLLLMLMGVNTAQIPNITAQIAQMGLDALLATLFVLVGSIIMAGLLSLAVSRRASHTVRVRQKISWERLKTPFIMIGTVVVGFLIGFFTPFFDWFSSEMINPVLYLLLFVAGMQMVQNEVNLIPLLKSPMMLLLPLSTILGTYLGALAIPLVTSYTLREGFALVSGFGWYSLSGVLISGMGMPHLGAVSFLSNLFRETLSFILIPLLATFSHFTYSSVSIAGATSMDVTLPLLKKSLGETIVPLAITHGVLMTLVAPLLIPLWLK